MNNVIEKELKNVKATKVDFEGKTKIVIPKTIEIIPEALEVDSVYSIELDDSLLNPTSNSVLAANWNAGRIPKHKHYVAEIISLMSGMVKVNAIPNEDNVDIWQDNFYGWLPVNNIKIIEKIKEK